MQAQTLQYDDRASSGPFPGDDSPRSLVLMHGAKPSPYPDGNCDLPSQTMTLTVIAERS